MLAASHSVIFLAVKDGKYMEKLTNTKTDERRFLGIGTIPLYGQKNIEAVIKTKQKIKRVDVSRGIKH